ncbi:MAG: aminopeptidase [Firmicutes bacterium HGW-Firmicutes-21]|nr:MAG: aminopeptidase [Firmicutes bacterium HGW-Firmicutes-21]
MIDLIKRFTACFSVAGDEEQLRTVIEKEIAPFTDSISVDALGNLIAYKKGECSDKKLMVAAHMDEIGFVVTYIEDSGIIRVSNIGGINVISSVYHTVRFKNGTVGVLAAESGTKPEEMKMNKLFIDIGARNKKEAEKKVRIGDTCAVTPVFQKLLNGRYAAKAFDNRIGCAVVADAVRTLKRAAVDTYFVFTVQEEVGCRGSKPAANSIMPDYAVNVDVTTSGDAPGEKGLPVKLGGGAAIKIKDKSVICSRVIIDRLTKLAERNKIKYQYEILTAGGTDTSSMQIAGSGCAAGCISIPSRYIHSPLETLDIADVRACSALLTAFIEDGIE